jgi:hypothetical protein
MKAENICIYIHDIEDRLNAAKEQIEELQQELLDWKYRAQLAESILAKNALPEN